MKLVSAYLPFFSLSITIETIALAIARHIFLWFSLVQRQEWIKQQFSFLHRLLRAENGGQTEKLASINRSFVHISLVSTN